MSGTRGLFLNVATAATFAAVLGMAAPAAAVETAGNADAYARMPRAPTKGYATRGVPAASSDRRQDSISAWKGRQFVLMIGIGY
jgi:hypothetical protein